MRSNARADTGLREIGGNSVLPIADGSELISTAIPATTSAGFSPEKAIAEQLVALEKWAVANEKDGRRAGRRFWLLKGPAFICAVAASGAESFGYAHAVTVLGAVAALAIAIDAAWSGPSNQVHFRALQDIRNLENAVKLKWDKVRLSHPDPKDAARSAVALAILDAIQTKRDQIARYLASPQAGAASETIL
jgi:hypothetical protein